MAPGQSLMDMDQNSKPNYTFKVEPNQENPHLLPNSDGKGLRNMIKQEETIITTDALDTQTAHVEGPKDDEVDIIGCTNNLDGRLAEAEDPHATECSSSFGDTFSDTERCSGMSEAEVESEFFCESALDEFSCIRRKKLSNQWRNFIRPLTWRCKWTELRIKEIESQALKYTRELAACDQRKHYLGIDQATLEGCGSKSLPFSSQNYRKKAMKRRKRKRVEEVTDTASYISQHNIFSYLENKRSNLDVSSMADDFINTAMTQQRGDCGSNNDASFLEFKDGDNALEQILSKIETVHSQVHKLRSQLDAVMSKHTAKFSSSENLSLLAPNDAQTSSAPSPTFSAGNGDTMSVGAIYNPSQNISDYDIGELVLPDGTISSYGEAFHIPDIIESTVGLLAAADIKPQMGDSCEDILDNVLIHNQAGEGDSHTFIGTCDQSTEKHEEPEKLEVGESVNPCSVPTTEPDTAAKSGACQEQSALQSCLATDLHFPRNKRKRGERKAGSVGWSKKGSGEPDNQ